jgi:hypothetical protein
MHFRLHVLGLLCCTQLAFSFDTNKPPRQCVNILKEVADPYRCFQMMQCNLPKIEESLRGLSHLSDDERFQIAGRFGSNMIAAVGSIYSHIAGVKYDSNTDTNFSGLQQKRVAIARDLLSAVRATMWTVAEGELRNGDHLFMGITGHFLLIKADGSAWKGVASRYYEIPIYEAVESDFEPGGKIQMQELRVSP